MDPNLPKRNKSPLVVLFPRLFPAFSSAEFDRCALFLSRVEYLARNRKKADVRSGKPQEERTVCKTEDFPESLKKKITLITYFRCVLFVFQFHLFHHSIFALDFSSDTKSESDDLFSLSIFSLYFPFYFCHEFFSVWVTGGCLFWFLLLFPQVLFCKVPGEECHISNRPGQPRHEPLYVSIAQIQEYKNTIWKIVQTHHEEYFLLQVFRSAYDMVIGFMTGRTFFKSVVYSFILHHVSHFFCLLFKFSPQRRGSLSEISLPDQILQQLTKLDSLDLWFLYFLPLKRCFPLPMDGSKKITSFPTGLIESDLGSHTKLSLSRIWSFRFTLLLSVLATNFFCRSRLWRGAIPGVREAVDAALTCPGLPAQQSVFPGLLFRWGRHSAVLRGEARHLHGPERSDALFIDIKRRILARKKETGLNVI